MYNDRNYLHELLILETMGTDTINFIVEKKKEKSDKHMYFQDMTLQKLIFHENYWS